MTSAQPLHPGASPPRRILLVEDNEAAGVGLSRLLRAQGFEVTHVVDGAAALDAFESGAPLDYLLTDMRLPDLDGRELARRSQTLVPPPRVALLTGWDIDLTTENPADWGIDWVIPKPIDINHLLDRLNET